VFLHFESRLLTSLKAKRALSATISSGIRSIFCYSPTQQVLSWSPFEIESDPLHPWVVSTLDDLAHSSPYGSGRVEIGLGFDSYHLPKDQVQSLFQTAKNAGIKLVTSHYVRNAQYSSNSLPQLLHRYGLLDSSMLLSHCSGLLETDADLIRDADAHVASTPSTEIQMAMAPGVPLCVDDTFKHTDIQRQCSLGVDCHSNNAGSIPGEMRLMLQAARGRRNERFIAKNQAPRKLDITVQDAFNLGTIQGARAIGMEGSIGSIAVGKKADLVVFSGRTPAMVCAAKFNPIAAVVLHSSPRDVEYVFVDGQIRKQKGVLVDAVLEDGGRRFAWDEVADHLERSQAEIQERVNKVDFVEARRGVIQAFGIREELIVGQV
jgi:cytosine/adenosine deaminase-related metal-dependent hydrolase